MLPYLHILIRVEDDGSLHALGAFSTKERLAAYQKDTGLEDSQVRLDFYNGPFDEDIKVIYAGHRRWNMDRFQLGGYFRSEGEAWNWVTQEGYVSVLRIDSSYAEEQKLQKEALELYAKLQKRWRLASYQELVSREGAEKARANITLRFYEDALESFKPRTRRDVRALYAFFAVLLMLPVAIFFYASSGPEYAENVRSVRWLPDAAGNISYYRSKQVQVYEFDISAEAFMDWVEEMGLKAERVTTPRIVSRYRAYLPSEGGGGGQPVTPGGVITPEQFEAWQDTISATITYGMVAEGRGRTLAVYDLRKNRAYFEQLLNF